MFHKRKTTGVLNHPTLITNTAGIDAVIAAAPNKELYTFIADTSGGDIDLGGITTTNLPAGTRISVAKNEEDGNIAYFKDGRFTGPENAYVAKCPTDIVSIVWDGNILGFSQ